MGTCCTHYHREEFDAAIDQMTRSKKLICPEEILQEREEDLRMQFRSLISDWSNVPY